MAKGSFIKRLTAIVLAAGLYVCFSLSVYAEKSDYVDVDKIFTQDGDDSIYISEGKFLYNFKGAYSGVTICGYVGDSKTLSIPNMINGREVSAIEKDSFVNDERIESVTFPNSIKEIGENCFNGCQNLKAVTLATGVSVFNKVFCDCPALQTMYFPQGVSSILESFMNCTSLNYVRFSRSVSVVDEHSFDGCVSLAGIEWMGGIVKLGNAFDNCTSLETVDIPEGLVVIDGSFDGCTSLNRINFPETLLYITGGFSGCDSLTELELPKKLLFVNEAFNDCENLAKLNYDSGTTISETAFMRCPKLVIEKKNHFIYPLLGWIAIIVVMLLTGFLVYRLLTFMADNLVRKKKLSDGQSK